MGVSCGGGVSTLTQETVARLCVFGPIVGTAGLGKVILVFVLSS